MCFGAAPGRHGRGYSPRWWLPLGGVQAPRPQRQGATPGAALPAGRSRGQARSSCRTASGSPNLLQRWASCCHLSAKLRLVAAARQRKAVPPSPALTLAAKSGAAHQAATAAAATTSRHGRGGVSTTAGRAIAHTFKSTHPRRWCCLTRRCAPARPSCLLLASTGTSTAPGACAGGARAHRACTGTAPALTRGRSHHFGAASILRVLLSAR